MGDRRNQLAAFGVALSLVEELFHLKEARSLTALRSLDTFLSSRMELLMSDVMALPPPQRADVKSTKDSRDYEVARLPRMTYPRRLAQAGSPRKKMATFSRLAMRSPLSWKSS